MIITSTDHFKNPPKKIVSLVPSQTELLSHFGLDEEVVGITKFCVHPHYWFKTKQRVGGTKNINIDLIRNLKPDLILANKEENVKDQIEELAKDFTVWVTDVNNFRDALKMITDVGKLIHKITEAEILIQQIKENFSALIISKPKLRTAYLIWKNPYMTVGGDTFIHDMMKQCGLQNIFENELRYPQINLEQLLKSSCQLIMLSTEPYPFAQKHIDEMQKQLPDKKIILADGEFFSWYGSRLLQAPEYFNNLLKNIKIGTLK